MQGGTYFRNEIGAALFFRLGYGLETVDFGNQSKGRTILPPHMNAARIINVRNHTNRSGKNRIFFISHRNQNVRNHTMRCFLIRLGMVGAEFKAARKVILRHLSGNSAFRKVGDTAAVSE